MQQDIFEALIANEKPAQPTNNALEGFVIRESALPLKRQRTPAGPLAWHIELARIITSSLDDHEWSAINTPQLGKHFQVNKSQIYEQLRTLTASGYIEQRERKPGGIQPNMYRVTQKGAQLRAALAK